MGATRLLYRLLLFLWPPRVRREHGFAIKYLWSRRDATFANLGDVSQTRATVGLYYAYLGRERFGAVDWR